ncbi:hypothetical protein DFP72DRAFT_856979 [Ephemerocybe angulata]|uniref:Uncharacterized protein n=1 Tax=Ephemerocybe angulata TaxID=980116 RepID=A0A8H6HDB4_9AGAR|nr:hypothetical protein DFP72DRAFT_856979 [Tulosesus angulatus]
MAKDINAVKPGPQAEDIDPQPESISTGGNSEAIKRAVKAGSKKKSVKERLEKREGLPEKIEKDKTLHEIFKMLKDTLPMGLIDRLAEALSNSMSTVAEVMARRAKQDDDSDDEDHEDDNKPGNMGTGATTEKDSPKSGKPSTAAKKVRRAGASRKDKRFDLITGASLTAASYSNITEDYISRLGIESVQIQEGRVGIDKCWKELPFYIRDDGHRNSETFRASIKTIQAAVEGALYGTGRKPEATARMLIDALSSHLVRRGAFGHTAMFPEIRSSHKGDDSDEVKSLKLEAKDDPIAEIKGNLTNPTTLSYKKRIQLIVTGTLDYLFYTFAGQEPTNFQDLLYVNDLDHLLLRTRHENQDKAIVFIIEAKRRDADLKSHIPQAIAEAYVA